MASNTVGYMDSFKYSTNGVPHGYSSLTPFLVLSNARAALDFYAIVFDAHITDLTEINGAVAHAELEFAAGRLQLGEPNPAYCLQAAPESESDCYSLSYRCPDVDAVVERAVAAGATVMEPVAKFVSGDRFAVFRDPFGVRWSVMTRVEDISQQESARRVAQWAATQQ